ncbi:SRPBCC family protein [Brevibacillus sp. SYSU BS000544]|uniref:SRPBCC family protein n=1 Tax=Brevibacillus sp. SYSU BS000544 TaxID=3416443 RepID=UPI003CE55D8F
MSDAHLSAGSTEGAGTCESVHKRIINAPREIVFSAWTSPELLAQWWGPKGFTNTFHEFELKPGGNWKLTMHGPNGVDYPNECVFDEISFPERFVLTHIGPVHRFQITAIFDDLHGKTGLTFRQCFETVEELERVKEIVVPANEENLDRLTEVVSRLTIQE